MNKISKVSDFKKLSAGDEVQFSGAIYTGRDQAHKKLVEILKAGKKMPLDLRGKIIYYCGPTATRPGHKIGSCGPTTSQRMDKLTEPLLKAGLSAMIGKGRRAKSVRLACKKYKSVYFLSPGGCGALLAERVTSKKIIAFSELGPEAIQKLEVKDFPLIVAIDTKGKSIYSDL